jgi:hypothetical protein
MKLVRCQYEYDVDFGFLEDLERLDCLVGDVEFGSAVVDGLLGYVRDGNYCKSAEISDGSLER